MRVTRLQAAENREQILRAAGRLLRQEGLDVGVDALSAAAGMTHGGIYSHFGSKDDLAAAALEHAMAETFTRWTAYAQAAPEPFAAFVRAYLSRTHRDHPGEGCALTCNGAEAARRGGKLAAALAHGARRLLDALAQMAPGKDARARRDIALLDCAAMIGALQLSRLLDDPDESDRLLRLMRARLLRPEIQS